MKLLILLTIIGVVSAYNQYRTQRDVIELTGNFRTSYDNNNIGYDYPRPLPEIQPPKLNLLYLPAETTPPPVLLKTNIEPIPSESRPKYTGTGNYIFEIQADEIDKSHKVDVENPFFRNTIHFVQ